MAQSNIQDKVQHNYRNQVVWIIGASSGIGAALARELAARGAKLALSARRQEPLEQLHASLGNIHKVFTFDVVDAAAVAAVAASIRAAWGTIDRVIFLAALYAPMRLDALDLKITRAILEANLLGALHLVHAILPLYRDQGYGQIALCGSVAGYLGLPNGQPYSATKAAIINLAESLQSEASEYVDVKLISPGFVRTPLTDKNTFHMPMMIAPEQAAKYIADGLTQRSFEVHFPKLFTLTLKLLRLLPYKLMFKIIRRFNHSNYNSTAKRSCK